MERLLRLKCILVLTDIIAVFYLLINITQMSKTPLTGFNFNDNQQPHLLASFVDRSHTPKPNRSIPINPSTQIHKNPTRIPYNDNDIIHTRLGYKVPSYMIIGTMKGGATLSA